MQVALREHPYFHRPPPKSTDVPEMITMFESATRSAQFALSPENLLATAAWLTGWSILQAVPAECELVASGGGTRNRFVMTMLERAGHGLKYSDELGVTSQAKEAIAFAILAAATLDGVPSNVPSATGAKKSVVLGSITPKP
jgi:anhydro-N-acetylmuramic acid kinase